MMVKDGAFSEDLWFLMNVSLIFIPPLRQRREDIAPMTEFFVEKKAAELKVPVPRIEQGSLKKIENFPWPGNVRELENVVERAMIRHGHGLLRIDPGMHPQGRAAGPAGSGKDKFLSLDHAMAAHIASVLKHTRGRISGPQGAAHILRMHPNTLRNRMDRLGIPFRKGG
jgi:DNA-binding NtrC family response regulator